ncbi:hypothetical protein NEUTE1DRAFT_119077 [Neurospora tetrasperma FGSC 2508]|uniref:Uncharacterized protein n=1 Tax=Neurospora tetrasperma (strain FGSC 2508 / ATCC MYA-4615 / P0657) TaxID=510951 RepID=F8N1D6_NEUT8|nr:uncharacterized protein NEUTE1DRAFT_119077 [Neurospora tetrasperma FGSC 2508]EGO53116.1 hypothetical protein NEUTE1DRAFT_119077 [Neurospora tetrasperma FGSC 2508]
MDDGSRHPGTSSERRRVEMMNGELEIQRLSGDWQLQTNYTTQSLSDFCAFVCR